MRPEWVGSKYRLQHLHPFRRSRCGGAEKKLGDGSPLQAPKGSLRTSDQLSEQGARCRAREAQLQNKSGSSSCRPRSISAEASGTRRLTHQRGPSDDLGPAAEVPIVNYEYAIVQSHQSSSQDAAPFRPFWRGPSTDAGNATSYLNQVDFVPLPSQVVNIAYQLKERSVTLRDAIARIHRTSDYRRCRP